MLSLQEIHAGRVPAEAGGVTRAEPRTQAPFGRRTLTVAERRVVGAYVVLAAEDPDGPLPRAGQFYMLAAARRWGGGADERPFLPRAFSVLRARDDRLEFMLEAVGPGTERLCELEPGDGLHVTGPLGLGFPDPHRRPPRPAVRGRGGHRAAGHLAGRAAGARRAGARRCWASATPTTPRAPRCCTTRASPPTTGRTATTASSPTCWPTSSTPGRRPSSTPAARRPCSRRCGRCAPSARVPCQLALEAGMACGFGACFGCVVPLRAGGYLRLCVDGPVLDGALLAEVPAH